MFALRRLLPRLSAPILPVTRTRPLAVPARPHARLFRNFPPRHSSPTRPALPPDPSVSQRLKHLIKSYGWYALGVYLVISVLDFGVAFAGINLLGADYVSRVAATAKQFVAGIWHPNSPKPVHDVDATPTAPAQSGHEGLYAMLVLAYTVHKTLFLPVRVGLTAALTPKLVGWLSQRGWAGGAGTRRAATEMRERLRERRNRGSQD